MQIRRHKDRLGQTTPLVAVLLGVLLLLTHATAYADEDWVKVKDMKLPKLECSAGFEPIGMVKDLGFMVGKELREPMSVEDEIALGDQVHKRNKARYGSKLNPSGMQPWRTYVTQLGELLSHRVKRTKIPYRFHVVDDPAWNAFAVPGGHIYVYRGLLEAVQNEAQLAMVLGHEIAHVDARHPLFLYGIVKTVFKGPPVEMIANLGLMLINHGFSASQEAEADVLGTTLASEARYSPLEAVHIWQGKVKGKTSSPRRDGDFGLGVEQLLEQLLATHPAPRVRACDNLATTKKIRKGTDHTSFYIGRSSFGRRNVPPELLR